MPSLARPLNAFSCRLCRAITLAVFLLILAVESLILVPSARRFERDELERLGDQAMLAVEPALTLGGGTHRASASFRELAAMVGQYRFAGLALYGADGMVLMRSGEQEGLALPANAAELSTMRAEHLARSADGRRAVFAWRSIAPGRPIVVARLDASHVRGALVAFMLRIGGLVAIIVLVVTAGTMVVLHAWVLRPLLALRKSALAAGADPDRAGRYSVHTRRHDEMGDVLRAYNAMLDRVAESKRRDREMAEEHAHFLSHHDALTGLPNGAALIEFLDRSRSRQGGRGWASLHLVDLVQFRELAASIGSQPGDALLRDCAARLQRVAAPEDFVAHLGADRFAIARPGMRSADEEASFAERILRETKSAHELADPGAVSMPARVGIAGGPLVLDGHALLGQAELALSRVRAGGCAEYAFFSKQLAEETRERRRLVHDLEHAVAAGELWLAYQPKMSVAVDGSAKLSGAEALLRWRSRTRGMVAPATFIPLAETSGLIVGIGDHVLRETCAQVRAWLDHYGWSPRVAVNLAAQQFALPDLAGRLEGTLAESGVPAEFLEVEVTETAAMRDVAATAATLAQLRALGVRVSIDDFGSGYSSLNYLRRFAVDAIKIDKSFVEGIGADRHAETICDAVLRLGQSLGAKVIAEGVENAVQLEFLMDRRCDEVQGYYLGRPVGVEEFERSWLAVRAAA